MGGKQSEWDGNINTTRESKNETPVENPNDGTFEYSNGTYGQSDYTVRSRSDGNYNLFIKSDSDKLHDHWVIDEDGNIVDKYHDFIFTQSAQIDRELFANQFLIQVAENLATDVKPLKLVRKLK